MEDKDPVEELGRGLEGSVKVPAGALCWDVELVTGGKDDHHPLIRRVVVEEHVCLSEGPAVLWIKV